MAKVVYLHGIRKATERKRWLDALNDSLVQVGYTTLSDDDVIDFDYVPILARATAGTSSEPKITKWTIETEELHRCQSEYLRSMAYFRSWLDVSSASGSPWTPPVPEQLSAHAKNVGPAQARYYMQHAAVRHAIWNEIIEALRDQTDIVLIGHSLGSVIAVDVIPRLPAKTIVRGLITVASPLGGVPQLRKHSRLLARQDDFPFDRVRRWVNVFEPRDVVANRGGIAQHYPMALDVDISTGPIPLKNHDVVLYAAHPVVAYAVRCSLSESGLPDKFTASLPARRIDPRFRYLLLKFSYAQNHEAAIPLKQGQRRRRLRLARECTARKAADLANRMAFEHGLVVPTENDFLNRATECLAGSLTEDDLIPLVMQLLSEPLLPPFQVETKANDDVRLDALDRFILRLQITDEATLPSRDLAHQCMNALREARDYMQVEKAHAWLKWAVLSTAGVAAIAGTVVTFGAAAPAGLAGAAAITSALAAIGPGGMAGGIATIAAITGAGSAAAAVGVAGIANDSRRGPVIAAVAELANAINPAELRVVLAVFIATVEAQEKLKRASSREDMRQALIHARAQADAHLSEACAVEPDGQYATELMERQTILGRAIRWFDRQEPDPSA